MAKQSLRDAAAEIADMMEATEHHSAWLKCDLRRRNKCLIFISTNPKTVKKARKALKKAGVLCKTPLGPMIGELSSND